MMSEPDRLARAQRETRVMTELVRLAASDHEYAEIVRLTLDLVEDLVSSPLLCLSVRESEEFGHYARARTGIDSTWAEEAGRAIARVHEARLNEPGARYQGEGYPLGSMAGFVSFPAWTRSGHGCMLGLGAPRTPVLAREEEQLMQRLAAQIALILDHALLLEQIERVETVDRLTGVASHRRLLEVLDYELRRHQYLGRRLGLLLVDVEGLDGINRSYGRHYGNHILTKLGVLIGETVRPIDLVARCGLDEFAAVLPETGEAEAEGLLHDLQEHLLTVEFAGGEVGLSAVVVSVTPGEILTPEGFLLRAEQALGEAKRQRRGVSARLQDSQARHARFS